VASNPVQRLAARHAPPDGPHRHAPTPAAARQRRWRARQRRGDTVAAVVVSHEIVGMLIDLGWLAPEVSESRAAVAEAIGKILAEAAKNSR